MKKLLILLLLLCPLCALAQGDAFSLSMPGYVHPYEACTIDVHAPEAGELTVTLEDAYITYPICREQVTAGDLSIAWDVLIANGEAPCPGNYTVRAALNGTAIETSIRVGGPALALQYCIPSGDTVHIGSEDFFVNYLVTAPCIMYVQLAEADAPDAVDKPIRHPSAAAVRRCLILFIFFTLQSPFSVQIIVCFVCCYVNQII